MSETRIIKEEKRYTMEEFSINVAEKAGTDHTKSKQFIKSLFNLISDKLVEEDNIPIYQFGTFKKIWVEERDGINPQTQEKIKIPAHNKVHFKPSSGLANEVNRRYRHLTPNVLDQLLTMTGMTKLAPELEAEIAKSEELQKDYSRAKKRAFITLIASGLIFLLLLAVLILVPAYYVNENNKLVSFINQVNRMVGLDSISDRLRGDGKSEIDEEIVSQFMSESQKQLSAGRKVIDLYTVQSGDSIFSIAKKYWENEYLWPDLYLLNQTTFSDPDIIHPGAEIKIYEKLGNPEKFSRKQRQAIVQSYIGIYRIYRALGEKELEQGKKSKGERRISDSRWTLYTAVRYDHKLLSRYKDAIYPEDREIIQKYIDKFGYTGKEKEEKKK